MFILVSFFMTGQIGAVPVYAQDFFLPKTGVMVHLSPKFDPPILKGIKVHLDNPFRFDFILDKGDSNQNSDQLKEESRKLIKYFLASLTIPEKDLWVNLSPYEKDRIAPESFGVTEMGRDLLAQDYILKQITASLIYPEGEIGKKFWKRIYEEAAKKYGNTNIPVNTFNKVWIVPEKAIVYENAKNGTAYVVESKLKVMLEQDYLSLEKHVGVQFTSKEANQLCSQIVREIIIPELTKEINEGQNFSPLRQVYNSLILATWYKKKIKDSILSQVYADKSKVQGIDIDDLQGKENIYQKYLQAFKKGVYNYIKDDIDPETQRSIPRKYFSGGITDLAMNIDIEEVGDSAMLGILEPILKRLMSLAVAINPFKTEPLRYFDQEQEVVIREAFDRNKAKYDDPWKLLPGPFSMKQAMEKVGSMQDKEMIRVFLGDKTEEIIDNLRTSGYTQLTYEVSLLRRRGTTEWVLLKGENHNVGAARAGPLFLYDIHIHNHPKPNPIYRTPSPNDYWRSVSYKGTTKFLIVTREGLTEYDGSKLKDVSVIEMRTMVEQGRKEFKKHFAGDTSEWKDTDWEVSRPYWDKIVVKRGAYFRYLEWPAVERSWFNHQDFDLVSLLRSPESEIRMMAIGLLVDLFTQDGRYEDKLFDLLGVFVLDPSEDVQLYVIDFLTFPKGDFSKHLDLLDIFRLVGSEKVSSKAKKIMADIRRFHDSRRGFMGGMLRDKNDSAMLSGVGRWVFRIERWERNWFYHRERKALREACIKAGLPISESKISQYARTLLNVPHTERYLDKVVEKMEDIYAEEQRLIEVSHKAEGRVNEIVSEMDIFLKEWLRKQGINTYISPEVWVTNRRDFKAILGEEILGKASTFFNVIFISADSSEDEIRHLFIHETLHRNSIGFLSEWLDEGITELMTRKCLAAYKGLQTDIQSLFSQGGAYQKQLQFFNEELLVPFHLNQDSLFNAYFYDDMRMLEDLLGETWQHFIVGKLMKGRERINQYEVDEIRRNIKKFVLIYDEQGNLLYAKGKDKKQKLAAIIAQLDSNTTAIVRDDNMVAMINDSRLLKFSESFALSPQANMSNAEVNAMDVELTNDFQIANEDNFIVLARYVWRTAWKDSRYFQEYEPQKGIIARAYDPSYDPELAVFVADNKRAQYYTLLIVNVKTRKLVAGAAGSNLLDHQIFRPTTFTYVRDKGYMRRAVQLLLKTKTLQGWTSWYGWGQLSRRADRMYKALAQDPKLKVIGNRTVGYNVDLKDKAQLTEKGGIDFDSDKMDFQIRNEGGDIKFHMDPIILEQLKNTPGFTPEIINIQPMTDLRLFLGLKERESDSVAATDVSA